MTSGKLLHLSCRRGAFPPAKPPWQCSLQSGAHSASQRRPSKNVRIVTAKLGALACTRRARSGRISADVVHLFIQTIDRSTARFCENERKNSMKQTSSPCHNQTGAKPAGHSHVLQVSFADRGGMIRE